jgi:hypothetical protein
MAALEVVMAERDEQPTRKVVVPFPAGRAVTLEVPTRLSDEDWGYMLRVFEAMKPGLTYGGNEAKET